MTSPNGSEMRPFEGRDHHLSSFLRLPIIFDTSFLLLHLGCGAICSEFFLRCLVRRLTISCLGCGQQWLVSNTFSLYEQQTVESCPCPCCGAYTLCCGEPQSEPRDSRHSARTGRSAVARR